jgi:hypothetical protein
LVAVKTYIVRAKRWEKGWELHIDGVGVTQSHGLSDALSMAKEYIALRTGDLRSTFHARLEIELGDGLDAVVEQTRRRVAAATEAQKAAAEESRKVARKLKAEGLTGRDIAAVLGVSPQRVSQLVAR